jgi:hypothetical protein
MIQYALVLSSTLEDDKSKKLTKILRKELTGYSHQQRLPKYRQVEDLDGNKVDVYAHIDHLQQYAKKNYAFGSVIGYIESEILSWAGTAIKSEVSSNINEAQKELLNIPNGIDDDFVEGNPHQKIMSKVKKEWNKITSIDTDKD